MEGGAVAGSAAAVRVGSWDAITKAVPSWMVTASSAGKPLPGGQCQAAGGCSAGRDRLVGLRDRRARMCGGGPVVGLA